MGGAERGAYVLCGQGRHFDDPGPIAVGKEPTGHTTPYEAACGGGSRGSGVVWDRDAGEATGDSGSTDADTVASRAVGVAAVHD
jgi:hypothetical protein